jgi:hypothetical protein
MVRFNDGTVMHYEYNGTSDVTVSALWDTYEEMYKHWRGDDWNECGCGQDEPVRLFTDYGDGFSWDGRACRHCRSITAGRMPYDDDRPIENGTPEWVHIARVLGTPDPVVGKENK